jgi:hypothetical protein
VVNEVRATLTTLDSWGSKCPPEEPQGYGPENPSSVMKYEKGVVQVATGFSWYRDEGREGCIIYQGFDGQTWPATSYKTATVLSCHPLMPVAMVETDATVNRTLHRGSDNELSDDLRVWQPLEFFHPGGDLQGVSQVVFRSEMTSDFYGGSPRKYVAGKGPLMKSLVPDTYRCPFEYPHESVGMGGSLAALLALMAFHRPACEEHGANRAETAILKNWQNNKWADSHSPRGCEFALVDIQHPSCAVANIWNRCPTRRRSAFWVRR